LKNCGARFSELWLGLAELQTAMDLAGIQRNALPLMFDFQQYLITMLPHF